MTSAANIMISEILAASNDFVIFRIKGMRNMEIAALDSVIE
jgi:hypothetical protein